VKETVAIGVSVILMVLYTAEYRSNCIHEKVRVTQG